MALKGTAWKPIGPSPIASASSRLDNGIVTSIAVHPANPSIVYLGTGGGGVWRTVDGGASWRPLFDRQVSLNIGEASAIAIDPIDPDTIYVGISGAAFARPGAFALNAIDTTAGRGLYKSADAGATWIRLGSGFPVENTGTADAFARDWIYSIVVDPANRQIVYLAAQSGVYRSVDGGLNWQLGTNAGGNAESLAVDLSSPVNARVLYAGVNGTGVISSPDGGVTWSVNNAASTALGTGFGKVVVALAPPASPANPAGVQVIYLTAQNTSSDNPVGFFVSTDAGATWSARSATNLSVAGATQGGYSFTFAVDPASPGDGKTDTIYLGCVRQLKSTDSGKTFASVAGAAPGFPLLHADTHVWAFAPPGPTPTPVYVGTDGGCHQSNDGGSTWTSHNSGSVQSTLFYNIDSKPDPAATVVVGALQDNGVQSTAGQPTLQWQARNGDGWTAVYDGGANSAVVYASDGVYSAAPRTRIFRSSNDGASYPTAITPWGTTSDQGAFITSIATRPGTAGTVYACGPQNLWQSLDSGSTWRIVDSQGGPGDIAVSPTDGNYVVHAVGRRVFLSTNALASTVGGPNGVQFADITRNLPNNGRNVQRVAFDPIDPTIVYAVLGGFDGQLPGQQGHVFRTTAASAAWTDISPPVDIPMGAIALDATTTPATIYVGTDLGVVRTVDLGRSWSVVDDIHLPMVPVTDLEFSEQAGVLRAATFGRGVFEFATPDGPSVNLSLQDGLDFESVCPGDHGDLTLEVVNVGRSDLTVISVARSVGSAAFSVLPFPSCPAVVAPGEQLDLVVRYEPTAPGGRQEAATIRVLTDDPGAPIVDVLATGEAGRAAADLVVPPGRSVGDVCVGDTLDVPVVISNSGTCALVIRRISFPPGSPFSVSTVLSYPVVIEAGASLTVMVRFAPTAQGAASATLTVTSNDPSSPRTAELTGMAPPPRLVTIVADSGDVGPACVGHFTDATLTIANSGCCCLSLFEIASDSAEFLVPAVVAFPLVIHAGDNIEVPIRFQPLSFGGKTATVTIVSDDPASPHTVLLHGLAPHGTLAVTGSACFGEVLFGTRVQQRLTFSNVGDCDLHVTCAGFEGCRCPGCEHLVLVRNPFPATLHPGAALDLVLQYTATGGSPCTRHLAVESDDPDHPKVIIDVSASTKMTLNGALRGWLASNLHSLLATVSTPPCGEGSYGPSDHPC
ncbi:MAG TPA: choice-of-anchor D domain-containing protein [Streptosporangiaceae bacterium]|nr:choice-of-anchor D domain-containing protein [Streptosporangiaceae bacterium]